MRTERLLPLALDLVDRSAVDAAVAQTIDRFGRIDVVVNNAGYGYLASPLNQGQTGVLGFAADASGRICWTPDGSMVPERAPGELDPYCRILD